MQTNEVPVKLENHPTVQNFHRRPATAKPAGGVTLDAVWLRQLVLEAGADDVQFVELQRPALAEQREDILRAFPAGKALISYVVRMNREPIRSPARSVANLEFHHTGDHVNEVGRQVVRALESQGVRALNPAMGFPMEQDKFPGKIWVLSHKPIAVAAGLGKMGIHRNVIHPQFGNFILLGTVVIEAQVTEYGQPIDYNPCLECKLCVAACPVGAIAPSGDFNFAACYSHNYREFMGGFTDWTEQVVDSTDRLDYRKRVSDSESASMWQSLSFGANYKAAYCLSVCPAGEEVIGPYLSDKRAHLQEVVKPLQTKPETVYVLRNSDAEEHVAKRFPQKTMKHVGNSLRPVSIDGFLRGMGLVFQPGKAAGLSATYHFTFTGEESRQATVVIADQQLTVSEGHRGKADLEIRADAQTWIGFLRQEKNIVWALVRRQVRLRGPLKLLLAFGKCFPQ
jgi:NAD-dependent dihydropyrimidine dehydrogenase PreA subunit